MDDYLQEMGFPQLCISISHLRQTMRLCPGEETQIQELPWGPPQQTHRNHLKNLHKMPTTTAKKTKKKESVECKLPKNRIENVILEKRQTRINKKQHGRSEAALT